MIVRSNSWARLFGGPGLLAAVIERYSVEPMITRASGERRDLLEALCDYLEEVRDVRRKDIKESWLNRQSKRLKTTLRKLDLAD